MSSIQIFVSFLIHAAQIFIQPGAAERLSRSVAQSKTLSGNFLKRSRWTCSRFSLELFRKGRRRGRLLCLRFNDFLFLLSPFNLFFCMKTTQTRGLRQIENDDVGSVYSLKAYKHKHKGDGIKLCINFIHCWCTWTLFTWLGPKPLLEMPFSLLKRADYTRVD